MVFFRKYRDTLVQLRRNIPFLREKIKQSEGIRKKWMYMTLLWQSVLAIVILVTSVVGFTVLIVLNWVASDLDLITNIIVTLIALIILFVFLLWSLFILRKVFPKMQENMIRRLEGED